MPTKELVQEVERSSPVPAAPRLVVFDTHPIQYRAPVLKELYRRHPQLKVFLFNDTFDGSKWWFRERNQIPPQKWELELREGYPNEVLGTAGLGLLGSYRRFNEILRRESPSAILVFGYFSVENWLLWWCCRARRIQLLFLGDTFTFDSRGWITPLKRLLVKLFFSGVSRFISNGDKNYAYYRAMGVEEKRLTRAKYCVDTSFFTRADAEAKLLRGSWRARLEIPESAFVILFVGRMMERKRPADVLRMWQRVPEAYAVFVGNGPVEAELRESAKGLAQVRFLGFQNQSQTREAYYGADVLVVPSRFETWGFVVNEAFACARPAVVTDGCAVAGDLVVPGETGYVYPVGDVDAAAELIKGLISDPEKTRRFGEYARRKVQSEYHIGQFAEAILGAVGERGA